MVHASHTNIHKHKQVYRVLYPTMKEKDRTKGIRVGRKRWVHRPVLLKRVVEMVSFDVRGDTGSRDP